VLSFGSVDSDVPDGEEIAADFDLDRVTVDDPDHLGAKTKCLKV
jgi:hypothetical protein|tara:strand:+ start:483 stop:614 length:132 start_codon:yes stop_codon:yes gene_type:complete